MLLQTDNLLSNRVFKQSWYKVGKVILKLLRLSYKLASLVYGIHYINDTQTFPLPLKKLHAYICELEIVMLWLPLLK